MREYFQLHIFDELRSDMYSNSSEEDFTKEIEGKMIVHWNYRDLAVLPEAIRFCADYVREIYLKDNKLTSLPDWLNELVNVTNLYLCGNNLRYVPSQIASMARLTLLDLGNNDLDDLPSCLGDLELLESLTLDDNFLRKLPSEFRSMKNLRSLSVRNNEFVALPEWLGDLEKLEQLGADENSLRELPNSLSTAPNLRILSISSNRLTYLPLKGFISRPSIYFRSNPHLNYLSYPMFRQLIDNPGDRVCELGKNLTYDCATRDCKNLQISINTRDHEGIIVELPRQLLKVHGIDANEPISLWELALRRIYDCLGDTRDNKRENPSFGLSYNLLVNGPIAVCVNDNCREPIFTETWLIAAISCPQDSMSKRVTIVALYCCKNCALNFDPLSEGFESLRWHPVRHQR